MTNRWNDPPGGFHPVSAPDYLPRQRLQEVQLQRLREMGCEFGQGFLFARPAPFDDIARRLREAPAGSGRAHVGPLHGAPHRTDAMPAAD